MKELQRLPFEKEDYDVYKTYDYSIFKKLLGNREVREERVSAIRESVEKRGWMRAPILVNEKLEIIDGQGRFEVAKMLNAKVQFIIQTGLGIDDCISMNIKQKNWGTYDFILCHNQMGNKSYSILLRTMEEYGRLNLKVIIAALTGACTPPITIKKGEFYCSEESYRKAKIYLDFIMSLLDGYLLRAPGNITFLQCGLIIILSNFDVDIDRLESVVKKHYSDFTPISTIENALENLEKYYNKGLRQGHQNFLNDYKFKIKRKKTDVVKQRYKNYGGLMYASED